MQYACNSGVYHLHIGEFFQDLINLTAQISPQTINEKILMMNLDFDNNLRAIIHSA